MILVTGGSGHLGAELIPLLTSEGLPVRVFTRDPARARGLVGDVAQLVQGDARDPGGFQAALDGVDAVVSAMSGFGAGAPGPKAVDYEGNLKLIRAAEASGVRRFVLVSINGASADHPMELMRMKFRAEEALRASRLDWVIVRASAFMEVWAEIIGRPVVDAGKATVFGRGDNPINFNSAHDVAMFVKLALSDSRLSRTILSIGGAENLTFNQLVGDIERAAGRKAAVKHVPLPVMRLLSLLLRPIKPDVAGMIAAGVAMDTVDMSFDASELRRRFPQIQLTRMADVLARRLTSKPAAAVQEPSR